MLVFNLSKRQAINTVKLLCQNMSTKCEVAVCQFTSTNDKERNLSIVKKLVQQAANKDAKVNIIFDFIFETFLPFLGSIFTRSHRLHWNK